MRQIGENNFSRAKKGGFCTKKTQKPRFVGANSELFEMCTNALLAADALIISHLQTFVKPIFIGYGSVFSSVSQFT